jgi:hypothetical protein
MKFNVMKGCHNTFYISHDWCDDGIGLFLAIYDTMHIGYWLLGKIVVFSFIWMMELDF